MENPTPSFPPDARPAAAPHPAAVRREGEPVAPAPDDEAILADMLRLVEEVATETGVGLASSRSPASHASPLPPGPEGRPASPAPSVNAVPDDVSSTLQELTSLLTELTGKDPGPPPGAPAPPASPAPQPRSSAAHGAIRPPRAAPPAPLPVRDDEFLLPPPDLDENEARPLESAAPAAPSPRRRRERGTPALPQPARSWNTLWTGKQESAAPKQDFPDPLLDILLPPDDTPGDGMATSDAPPFSAPFVPDFPAAPAGRDAERAVAADAREPEEVWAGWLHVADEVADSAPDGPLRSFIPPDDDPPLFVAPEPSPGADPASAEMAENLGERREKDAEPANKLAEDFPRSLLSPKEEPPSAAQRPRAASPEPRAPGAALSAAPTATPASRSSIAAPPEAARRPARRERRKNRESPPAPPPLSAEDAATRQTLQDLRRLITALAAPGPGPSPWNKRVPRSALGQSLAPRFRSPQPPSRVAVPAHPLERGLDAASLLPPPDLPEAPEQTAAAPSPAPAPAPSDLTAAPTRDSFPGPAPAPEAASQADKTEAAPPSAASSAQERPDHTPPRSPSWLSRLGRRLSRALRHSGPGPERGRAPVSADASLPDAPAALPLPPPEAAPSSSRPVPGGLMQRLREMEAEHRERLRALSERPRGSVYPSAQARRNLLRISLTDDEPAPLRRRPMDYVGPLVDPDEPISVLRDKPPLWTRLSGATRAKWKDPAFRDMARSTGSALGLAAVAALLLYAALYHKELNDILEGVKGMLP